MKKRIGILVFVLALILISVVDAGSNELTTSNEPLSSHEIILDAFSWIAYDLECHEDEQITGSFEVTCDGSLYIGDSKKYDDWSLEGIQFYILDYGNYLLFEQREEFRAAFERSDIQDLTWTFIAPHNGTWYIVYENQTIYLMNIEGSINRLGASNTLIAIAFFTIAGLGTLGVLILIKRK